jgi:general secretion pathway protein G
MVSTGDNRGGFSLVELIFVIVISAILASLLIPQLSITQSDATLTKAKSQITTIRSALQLAYSESIQRADPTYPRP